MQLPESERKQYEEYVERLRKLASQFKTEQEEIKDAIREAGKKAESKGKIELVLRAYKKGSTAEAISGFLDLPVAEVNQIIADIKHK